MNLLRWAPYPQADVVSYNVYRAIVGFVATLPAPAALAGLTLTVAVDGGAPETVTFDGTTDAVTAINAQVTRGTAYASQTSPDAFLFRSPTRQAPGSVQVIDGTALGALGLVPQTITEQSNAALLANVLPGLGDPSAVMTLDDADGVAQDWYAVSTIGTNGSESYKTPWRQPATTTGPVCVIEGIVVDLQGVRIPDCEVRATVQNMPQSPQAGMYLAGSEPVCAFTGEDGRFSLALLQGAQIFLEIPAINYSLNTAVPAQPYVFLTDLKNDTCYRAPVDFK